MFSDQYFKQKALRIRLEKFMFCDEYGQFDETRIPARRRQRDDLECDVDPSFTSRSFLNRGLSLNQRKRSFMTAALHCLSSCREPLINLISYRIRNQAICESCGEYEVMYKYAVLVGNLFTNLLDNEEYANVANSFYHAIKFNSNFSEFFLNNEEEYDANLFMCNFINYIDDCVTEIEIIKNSMFGTLENKQLFEEAYLKYFRNENVMKRAFAVRYEDVNTCENDPSHEFKNVRPRYQLSLPIEGCETLEECFNHRVIMECRECGEKEVEFKLEYRTTKTSPYLIIQLERFQVI